MKAPHVGWYPTCFQGNKCRSGKYPNKLQRIIKHQTQTGWTEMLRCPLHNFTMDPWHGLSNVHSNSGSMVCKSQTHVWLYPWGKAEKHELNSRKRNSTFLHTAGPCSPTWTLPVADECWGSFEIINYCCPPKLGHCVQTLDHSKHEGGKVE